jgi:hypothetical protein
MAGLIRIWRICTSESGTFLIFQQVQASYARHCADRTLAFPAQRTQFDQVLSACFSSKSDGSNISHPRRALATVSATAATVVNQLKEPHPLRRAARCVSSWLSIHAQR